ncbi:MAG TPA: glycosyltransferase [Thermoplasmatales archaeon]|nr:glycosyltransferase [Thermoplasmatales archaeon]
MASEKVGQMKNLPLVSIVTPSYNQGQFIEETILSVKNQNYPNIEHIIVDGGSTDNTLEILKKYEGTYNMRWVSEPDEGMYQAINKGLRMAKGEILSYLNSDDLYLPWTVETVVAHLTKNLSVDLVYGDVISLDMENKTLELIICPPFNLKFLHRAGGFFQPTVFWRRKVFEQLGGFDETLKFVADCDYWMKVGTIFGIRKINEVLAIDRLHGSAKRSLYPDVWRNELKEVRKRYCKSGLIQKNLELFIYRLYGPFWQRYYMVKFLYRYLTRHKSKDQSAWSRFLSIKDLQMAPWHQLLIRFVPFIGRRNPRWTIKRGIYLREVNSGTDS